MKVEEAIRVLWHVVALNVARCDAPEGTSLLRDYKRAKEVGCVYSPQLLSLCCKRASRVLTDTRERRELLRLFRLLQIFEGLNLVACSELEKGEGAVDDFPVLGLAVGSDDDKMWLGISTQGPWLIGYFKRESTRSDT